MMLLTLAPNSDFYITKSGNRPGDEKWSSQFLTTLAAGVWQFFPDPPQKSHNWLIWLLA